MTSISSLNKVHHLGQYGNFENKDENQLIKGEWSDYNLFDKLVKS